MFRRYSCCMTVITSGTQITFNWPIYMGSVGILFVLSAIEFHYCLTVSVVRVVVLRYRVLGLRLVLHLRLLRRSCESARFTACPGSCFCCVGPTSLSNPLHFLHTRKLGSFAAWFPLQLAHVRLLPGHYISRPSRIPCIRAWVFCRRVSDAGEMYASWFAAAAAGRVCEFVAVEASVDSSRFDVVPGAAVAASEEYTVSFIVNYVYLVAESDHYGAVIDVVQSAFATSIRGGSSSIFLSILLLSWSSISISAGDVGLSWSLRMQARRMTIW